MNYDRAALKYEVKEDMRLIRPRPLLATLIFLLVSAALTGLIQWLQSWMTAGGIQELMDLMGLVEMAEYGLTATRSWCRPWWSCSGALAPWRASVCSLPCSHL